MSSTKEREDSQNLNNDTFYRPVTGAHCVIKIEKHPDSGILSGYFDDHHSQGYSQVNEAFKALTKNEIFQPYTTDHDFRSSNEGNDIG